MVKAKQESDLGLLYGANAIAAFLGVTRQQAYKLIELRGLPAWKEGKTVVARRSTLAAWLDERERAGMARVREEAE